MSEIGLYEAMGSLRAVRRLRKDVIPEDVLARVLRAATWAPSGGNVQPWRVVVVQDAAKKRRLQELYVGPWKQYARGHRKQVEPLAGEARAKQERMLDAADHLAEHLHEAPAILVFCFEPKRMAITDASLGRPSVVGGGSVYPAVQNAMLACRAEGLGCTLTTLLCFAEREVKPLLAIPDEWYTCAFVPIGYPAGKGHGPISRRSVDKMAFRDAWGAPFRVGPASVGGESGS
jgi:nitroreductase